MRRAVRSLRWLAALSAAALAVAVSVALVDLRAISEPPRVDVPIPASAVEVDGGLVRGVVRTGLPPYGLHWDGQPPSAILVDRSRDVVLAAGAFSEATFARNRNAVRFTDGEVRFVLDARRWSPRAGALVLRCEAVKSRTRFELASAAAAALLTLLIALLAAARHADTPQHDRTALRRRLAESAVFLAIAAALFASLYPGAPVRVDEVTDEAAINGFSAALDHPDRFTQDPLLSDPANFAWYTPVHVNAVRAFKRLGFHYQTANAFLGVGLVVGLLFGLRRLFAAISGSAAFGFAAAIGLGLMFDASMPPPGEYWSIVSVLPRMLFTACAPWVLLLALYCAPSSRRWWMACAAAGLLANIHPLSAPALIGALLVGFVAASDESWPARTTGAALAAAAAVVAMSSFVFSYTRRYGSTVDVDPAMAHRALELVRATFADLAPAHIIGALIEHRVRTFRVLLDGLAVVLLVRHRLDRSLRFYIGIVVGFLLVTFGVPAVDGAFATALGRRPYEFEMVRNVRYADLLLVGALALAVRGWQGTRRQGRMVIAVGAVFAALALGPGWLHTGRFLGGNARMSWRILRGHPDAAIQDAQEAIRAIQALRPAGSRVWGVLGLRQFDVPLAWLPRDVIAMSYSTSRGLLEAADVMDQTRPLLARPLTAEALAQISAIGGAPMFLLRRTQIDESLARSARVLFENRVYVVVSAMVE